MAVSLFLTIAVLTMAQVQQQPVPPQVAAPDASILRRIEAGDVVAISDAGKTGNRSYIPALSKIVRGSRFRGDLNDSASEQARLALAKLGAPEQLQQYWCAAISELPTERALHPPISIFRYVGGWYSIKALSYFLGPDSDVHWRRAGRKHKGATDIGYHPPQVLALQTLPKVVSDPPIAESRANWTFPIMEQEAAIWRQWLAEHEPELRRLEPTGEGVEISAEACRDGQPRNRRR